MGMTSQQNIPNKPATEEPWTFKRLLSFGAITTTLTKIFINPFDVLLGYLIFILGIVELIGKQTSWFLWGFVVLLLFVDLFERHTGIPLDTKINKKAKK